jgi:hypothetical protein
MLTILKVIFAFLNDLSFPDLFFVWLIYARFRFLYFSKKTIKSFLLGVKTKKSDQLFLLYMFALQFVFFLIGFHITNIPVAFYYEEIDWVKQLHEKIVNDTSLTEEELDAEMKKTEKLIKKQRVHHKWVAYSFLLALYILAS